jgi:hypothetical protein
MAFSLFDSKGTPIENQRYSWRDMVRRPLQKYEQRDPAEIITCPFDSPIDLKSQRDFYRQVLVDEVDPRRSGTQFVPKEQENQNSVDYRGMLYSEGEPSGLISAGYIWTPGTELMHQGDGATSATGTQAAARMPFSSVPH